MSAALGNRDCHRRVKETEREGREREGGANYASTDLAADLDTGGTLRIETGDGEYELQVGDIPIS